MNKKQIIRWGQVLLCMWIIWLFSAQNGDKSGDTSNFVIELLRRIRLGELLMQYINIRKLAHFSIYFLLGITTCRAVSLHIGLSKRVVLISLLISFAYACTDEFHQYFVPGRCADFRDVCIDTAGALTGMLLVFLVMKRRTIVS